MCEEKTIFKKIIDKELPANIVYEDEVCMAFHDVSPQAPTHVLVIPKSEIPSVADLEDSDGSLAGHLILVARNLARDLELDGGFRLVINSGPEAGQTVDHLHIHLLGGRRLSWPPG